MCAVHVMILLNVFTRGTLGVSEFDEIPIDVYPDLIINDIWCDISFSKKYFTE